MANARKLKRKVNKLEAKEDARLDALIDALRTWASQLDSDTGVALENYLDLIANIKKTNEE